MSILQILLWHMPAALGDLVIWRGRRPVLLLMQYKAICFSSRTPFHSHETSTKTGASRPELTAGAKSENSASRSCSSASSSESSSSGAATRLPSASMPELARHAGC